MSISYECLRCHQTITLEFTPKYPPACACRPRHAATVMTVKAKATASLRSP